MSSGYECDNLGGAMAAVVINLSDKRKQPAEEIFAEFVPLQDGGLAVVTELDGTEYRWEFDCAQIEITIRALTLAFVTRKSVRIAQPVPIIRSA